MRAGLVANTVHVPDTWGGWRIHPSQATDRSGFNSPEHLCKIEDMIENACAACENLMSPPLRHQLRNFWGPITREHRTFRCEFERRREDWFGRQVFAAGSLVAGSPAAVDYVKSKLLRRPPWAEAAPNTLKCWLDEAGFGPALVPIEDAEAKPLRRQETQGHQRRLEV